MLVKCTIADSQDRKHQGHPILPFKWFQCCPRFKDSNTEQPIMAMLSKQRFQEDRRYTLLLWFKECRTGWQKYCMKWSDAHLGEIQHPNSQQMKLNDCGLISIKCYVSPLLLASSFSRWSVSQIMEHRTTPRGICSPVLSVLMSETVHPWQILPHSKSTIWYNKKRL